MKFPPDFDIKLDARKLKWQDPWAIGSGSCCLQRWVNERVTGLLGVEDDVLIEMILNMLKEACPVSKDNALPRLTS